MSRTVGAKPPTPSNKGRARDIVAEQSVFDDIIEALHEVEDYQNGNIELRADVVEIPDEYVLSRFSLLSENDKYFVSSIIDRLLAGSEVG